MRIALLTSSRADYGIYLPLMRALHNDPACDLRIIAFGTHLSSFHGHTIDQIKADGFHIDYEVENILASDSELSVASSMALTLMRFAEIWSREKNNYDLVLCLGDRYEMFSAVSASVPFGLKIAHIHGGETTLGAIDNSFRHCLSIFSDMHFVSAAIYAQRVEEIRGNNENIHVVGSLSLDNLNHLQLYSYREFNEQNDIDLTKETILVTYHPETVKAELNTNRAQTLIKALGQFAGYQIIITMPNADTSGNSMRKVYLEFASDNPNIKIVENFGTRGYFSCMKLCNLVVGNSSSGIIEAASFKKHVVNIGDRQKGRAVSDNVINADNEERSIVEPINKGLSLGDFNGENVYYNGGAVEKITKILLS